MNREEMMKWIVRADLFFREKMGPQQIEAMTDMWVDALSNCSRQEIEEGFLEWFKKGKYFPRAVDICVHRVKDWI